MLPTGKHECEPGPGQLWCDHSLTQYNLSMPSGKGQHALQGGMNLNQDQQGGGDSGYGGNQDSGYGGQSTDTGYGGGQGTDTGYGGGQGTDTGYGGGQGTDTGYGGQTTDTGFGGGDGQGEPSAACTTSSYGLSPLRYGMQESKSQAAALSLQQPLWWC